MSTTRLGRWAHRNKGLALAASVGLVSSVVVLTGISAGAATAAPSGTFDVPSTIPATCSASSPDETAALQSFVNSVPNNSNIVFRAGTCYRMEGTLNLINRSHLTFEGNGAILRSFTDGTGFVSNVTNRHHIFCQGGTDLAFTDLSVVGSNKAHSYNALYQGQSGWWVWGTQGFTLTDVTVTNVLGDFVTIGPDANHSWLWADDVTITGSTFAGSGRQGITVTGAENVSIAHNRLIHAALSAFDIEPDSGTGPLVKGVPTYGGANNVTISDNEVGPVGTTFLSITGAPATVSNITVEGNDLVHQPLNVIASGYPTEPRDGLKILNNTVTENEFGSPIALINLTYQNQAEVSGNNAALYAPEPTNAVDIYGCDTVAVTNNAFPGAGAAVSIDGDGWTGTVSSNITVTGNTGSVDEEVLGIKDRKGAAPLSW